MQHVRRAWRPASDARRGGKTTRGPGSSACEAVPHVDTVVHRPGFRLGGSTRSASFPNAKKSGSRARRQVFWLADHPTGPAFPAALWRPVAAYCPSCDLTITQRPDRWTVRPRLQRRPRGGFSPPSLQALGSKLPGAPAVHMSATLWRRTSDVSSANHTQAQMKRARSEAVSDTRRRVSVPLGGPCIQRHRVEESS
jgi:hypothetical protein